MDKATRLARYNLKLVAITFPTSRDASEAVGFLLIALDLSDPASC